MQMSAAAGTTTQSKQHSSWLCSCFGASPRVAHDGDDGAAAHPASKAHTTAAGRANGGTVVLASAHSFDAADTAPAASRRNSSDQGAAAALVTPAGLPSIKTTAAAAAAAGGAMAGDAVRSGGADQGATPRTPTMAELRHVMASSLGRPYTDKDWHAALRMLEAVIAQQRQHALAQLRIASNGPNSSNLHRSSFASAASGNECWHDARSHTMSDASAVSEAERAEVALLASELELLRGPVAVSVVRELDATPPACVPNPPLLAAEPHWKYRQADPSAFLGFYERDHVCSTPFPLPIDLQLQMNKILRVTHESIPGMKLHMHSPTQLCLTAAPATPFFPGVVAYTEFFNMDSTPNAWTMRRDVRFGRTEGQMFMTTDGILIFRVFTSGVFSRAIEWIGEDYMRLEDNGQVIVTRQVCKYIADGSVVGQYLVGRKKPEGAAGPLSRRNSSGTGQAAGSGGSGIFGRHKG